MTFLQALSAMAVFVIALHLGRATRQIARSLHASAAAREKLEWAALMDRLDTRPR